MSYGAVIIATIKFIAAMGKASIKFQQILMFVKSPIHHQFLSVMNRAARFPFTQTKLVVTPHLHCLAIKNAPAIKNNYTSKNTHTGYRFL